MSMIALMIITKDFEPNPINEEINKLPDLNCFNHT